VFPVLEKRFNTQFFVGLKRCGACRPLDLTTILNNRAACAARFKFLKHVPTQGNTASNHDRLPNINPFTYHRSFRPVFVIAKGNSSKETSS
jgi:hypothetical protein